VPLNGLLRDIPIIVNEAIPLGADDVGNLVTETKHALAPVFIWAFARTKNKSLNKRGPTSQLID